MIVHGEPRLGTSLVSCPNDLSSTLSGGPTLHPVRQGAASPARRAVGVFERVLGPNEVNDFLRNGCASLGCES